MENNMDLIPANKRLADAAARLQVMQLSQYNAGGAAETSCEMMMDKLLDTVREQYDHISVSMAAPAGKRCGAFAGCPPRGTVSYFGTIYKSCRMCIMYSVMICNAL